MRAASGRSSDIELSKFDDDSLSDSGLSDIDIDAVSSSPSGIGSPRRAATRDAHFDPLDLDHDAAFEESSALDDQPPPSTSLRDGVFNVLFVMSKQGQLWVGFVYFAVLVDFLQVPNLAS